MSATLTDWVIFNLLIAVALGVDLIRSSRNPHPIGVREALLASSGWIALALLFNGWIFWAFGSEQALAFLTGYLLEKSLSVDNLFIFLLIFAHFNVPPAAKHQVLFYGVVGAIAMRALMIMSGIALVSHFDWVFILFGLFLIVTGVRLAFKRETEGELEESLVYRWLKKKIRFTSYHEHKFFVKRNGQWLATPLLAVLILIEITDLIFALDSVPAILGITKEPFIVYTSNIFAILGLRSLFFALEGMMKAFYLLHYALAFILIFIGGKMLFASVLHISTGVTLLILIIALSIAVGGSLLFPRPTCQAADPIQRRNPPNSNP